MTVRQVEAIQQNAQLAGLEYVEHSGEEDTYAYSDDVKVHEATLRGP